MSQSNEHDLRRLIILIEQLREAVDEQNQTIKSLRSDIGGLRSRLEQLEIQVKMNQGPRNIPYDYPGRYGSGISWSSASTDSKSMDDVSAVSTTELPDSPTRFEELLQLFEKNK